MDNLLISHSILNRKIRKKYVQKVRFEPVWTQFSKFLQSWNWELNWQPKIHGPNWTEPEPTVQFFQFSVLASVQNWTLASLDISLMGLAGGKSGTEQWWGGHHQRLHWSHPMIVLWKERDRAWTMTSSNNSRLTQGHCNPIPTFPHISFASCQNQYTKHKQQLSHSMPSNTV